MALVPTVPGTGKNRHKGAHLHKYGHMRVRDLLSREIRAGGGAKRLKEGGHKVTFQFSSLSSLTKSPVRERESRNTETDKIIRG